MNAHPTTEVVRHVVPAASRAPEGPVLFPRQGVAAALVVERDGAQHVRPVIVVDFYREADLP
jgi:hypothetical protein